MVLPRERARASGDLRCREGSKRVGTRPRAHACAVYVSVCAGMHSSQLRRVPQCWACSLLQRHRAQLGQNLDSHGKRLSSTAARPALPWAPATSSQVAEQLLAARLSLCTSGIRRAKLGPSPELMQQHGAASSPTAMPAAGRGRRPKYRSSSSEGRQHGGARHVGRWRANCNVCLCKQRCVWAHMYVRQLDDSYVPLARQACWYGCRL